jgi:hypothetical protein
LDHSVRSIPVSWRPPSGVAARLSCPLVPDG